MESIGIDMEKLHFLQYYSADYLRCNYTLSFTEKDISKMLCVPEAVRYSNSLLSSATGRADQILHSIIKTVSVSLAVKNEF